MTEKLTSYYALLVESIAAQDANDEQREDDLLARMDFLWLQMSRHERAQSKVLSRIAAAGTSEVAFETTDPASRHDWMITGTIKSSMLFETRPSSSAAIDAWPDLHISGHANKQPFQLLALAA